MTRTSLYFVLFNILILSCVSNKPLHEISTEPGKLKRMVNASQAFNQGFTGFALYDPKKGEWLYQHQSNLLFTPASNTKILTLYTVLQVMGDSLAFAAVKEKANELTIYGLGDPTFLHPAFSKNDKVWSKLIDETKQISFSDGHMTSERFGPGWAWDDFRYYYQPERTYLPLYGNSVHYRVMDDGHLTVEPRYFESYTNISVDRKVKGCKVERDEFSNSFTFIDGNDCGPGSVITTPYNVYPYLTKELLEDTLRREIGIEYAQSKDIPLDHVWYSTSTDTVLRRMMYQSDNFVAEQLMLQASALSLGYMDSDSLIHRTTVEIKRFLPDSIRWVDASGLSRYNLISPRSLVLVLYKLQKEYGVERMLDLFPAGGENGTIKDWYRGENSPYIFAKTGSMSNVHCLSGYVRTDSGRLLIFSFMHRQFYGSSKQHKEEMERILEYIKSDY